MKLCLKSDCLVAISDEVSIALPSIVVEQPLLAAERMKELGYDTLVAGLYESSQLPKRSLNSWSWPLKLIVKPTSYSKRALKELFQALPIDAIFFESSLEDRRDALLKDLVLDEMKRLEELQGPLIFYVPIDERHPKRQARWLPRLCEEAGPKTSIAFSAFQGAPWHDHLPLHPFWEVLSRASHFSTTPLIPIVNTGMVGFGEGRWPAIPFDLFERCYSRCVRHNFARPIALAPHLPERGSALDCSLSMGARLGSSELLAEEWLRKNHPSLEFDTWRRKMQKGREIALELGAQPNSQRLLARIKSEFSSEDAERFLIPSKTT